MGRVKCRSQTMGYESAFRIRGVYEALNALIISRSFESEVDMGCTVRVPTKGWQQITDRAVTWLPWKNQMQ